MTYGGDVPRAPLPPRASAASRLRRSAGALSTAATAGMEEQLPWFSELSAQDRSWVGVIVQAGVQNFVEWYAAGGPTLGTPQGGTELAATVFGAAPRALAGVITLQQTVDLVRLSIDVVEASVDDVLEGEDAEAVHAAILRYAREVAFATAEVYARAAEARGAWDARLEALVVDAVLRAETDETLLSRASALGWRARGEACVVIGRVPAQRSEADLFEHARHLARSLDLDALCAVQGDRLVLLLGGAHDPRAAGTALLDVFDPGSALLESGEALETLRAYLEGSRSIEAAARTLFVHANTVRYRLRRITELTGHDPTTPRGGLALQLALILGRQAGH